MPGPTLPTELVAEIIKLVAETPAFEFLTTNWAEGVQTDTLKSLCLVSRTFSALATPHLYTHPILPTVKIGLLLMRTLQSDRWQMGEMAGQARGWVRSLTLGREVQLGKEVDGTFVVTVLGGAKLDALESVGVVGVKFQVDPFAVMRSKSACEGLLSQLAEVDN